VAEQITATQQRALQLVDCLNGIALAIRSNTGRVEKQIDAGMAALAHHRGTTVPDEVGRTLAEARVTGPFTERVGGVGHVAAPTAVEWVYEYARRVRKHIVDEFWADRWWPEEWELNRDEYEAEIEYARNNPPAALLLAVREHISPLFRWWRRGGEKMRAEIRWESRRAIECLERRQSRPWFSESPFVTFGNWTTPQVASEPPCALPGGTQDEQVKSTRGPEKKNIEPYKVLSAHFTSKTTAGKIADEVERNPLLREKLLSAGANLDSRKEIIRLAGNFLKQLRRHERDDTA